MIEPVTNDVSAALGTATANDSTQTILIRLDRVEQLVQRNHADYKNELHDLRRHLDGKVRVLNNNIRCFAGTIEGGFRYQKQQQTSGRRLRQLQATINLEEVDEQAVLSHNPRSLKELWVEFKFGLNGNKPAEQFTRKERNANRSIRQKYYRRKVFWDLCAKMINQGFSLDNAIRKIRGIYGHSLSITKILDMLGKDRKRGGHPNLL